ncbi:LysR family transcriptional regulator [soil metagenome]
MDRFVAMTAFVTVADQRGFAAAARSLGLSPPAVTRLIAGLEDALSIRLLQRTTRSVTLTDAGTRYLEHARRILAELAEAEDAARAERSEPTGRFVVTAPNVFGRREVAPLVSTFMAAHPAVVCELILADRIVDLVGEHIDVAVRIGVLEDSSLRARVLGTTRRVLVASPAYLAAGKRPRSPDDLARHALIQLTATDRGAEWRFVHAGAERRTPIWPRFITNSVDAAIDHAVRGGGIAPALSYQVADQVRDGTLEIVLPRFEPPALPIQLVYTGARLHSAATRAFIELAVATRRWAF